MRFFNKLGGTRKYLLSRSFFFLRGRGFTEVEAHETGNVDIFTESGDVRLDEVVHGHAWVPDVRLLKEHLLLQNLAEAAFNLIKSKIETKEKYQKGQFLQTSFRNEVDGRVKFQSN